MISQQTFWIFSNSVLWIYISLIRPVATYQGHPKYKLIFVLTWSFCFKRNYFIGKKNYQDLKYSITKLLPATTQNRAPTNWEALKHEQLGESLSLMMSPITHVYLYFVIHTSACKEKNRSPQFCLWVCGSGEEGWEIFT